MADSARQERAWVQAAQAGSASAIEALFRLHWPRAYRAAYLVVHDGAAAEDIAQEAFLAALRRLDRFHRWRPYGPWVHRRVGCAPRGTSRTRPPLSTSPTSVTQLSPRWRRSLRSTER